MHFDLIIKVAMTRYVSKEKKLDQAIVHVTPALFCLARLKEKKKFLFLRADI